MKNRNFGKLIEDDVIEYADNVIDVVQQHVAIHFDEDEQQEISSTYYTHNTIMHPTADDYLSASNGPFYPIVDIKQEVQDGDWLMPTDKGELSNGTILKKYDVMHHESTIDDYDKAMEKYLQDTRFARGYTTREPTSYINSQHPRWHQDAVDWIAFRDSVMEYGLSVMNDYQQSGTIVTLDEFIDGFPSNEGIWTYDGQE